MQAGDDAGKKPHRRAGVAAVDRILRRGEPFESFAFDPKQPIVAGDLHPERFEGFDRAVVVLAAGEIGDAARAVRDRGKDDRAVADRLVARDGQFAL
jgi:hypothetical protein